ncbi:hypothetical protein HK100_004663 [Physocladia obscura]|uniref:Asl1-like glycosyl hydrolase catalytic domain-containing protein n=1 Tax=Physocladia obscura TaxID=109957 RepID=A0AAD5SSL7_9FUNG|nr:hypothetical protein HK100_004663 [Physocladia obscura]
MQFSEVKSWTKKQAYRRRYLLMVIAVVIVAAGIIGGVLAKQHSGNTAQNATSSDSASSSENNSTTSASAVIGSGSQSVISSTSATVTSSVSVATSTNSPSIGKKGYSYTGTYAELNTLDAHWFYNWASTQTAVNPDSALPFVPMIWGPGSITTSVISSLTISGTAGVNDVLLGFNEPDSATQANTTPEQAIALWPQFISTGRRLGSPAVAQNASLSGSDSWLAQFMSLAKTNNYRVDFITLHYYPEPGYASALLQLVDEVYALYDLPIWLTEFCPADWSASASNPTKFTAADSLAFMTEVIPALYQRSYVERFAWFSYAITDPQLGFSSLFNSDGTLTSLGTLYQSYQN